ncbi:MAG: hypothetical protein LBP56_03695 [Odoribacteraceae bacterium]|jgi:hypothetical protein|nr:hypothetical protein [Odoribacteraceae bacterium]
MKQLSTILLLACAAIFSGCGDEEFKGTDNAVIAFSLQTADTTYAAAITADRIIVAAPAGADLSGAEARYTLSERATILPDPATVTDWNGQHVFQVKSRSRAAREYTYAVTRAEVVQPGNVTLLTQSDVTALAARGITVIDGNLVIGAATAPPADSITDLSPLAALKEVRYNIIIHRSFAGKELLGLDNLERCGGLHVGTTTARVDLPAVEGLSIDLPALKAAGDIVLNSGSLKRLSLGALASAASLFVASPALVALDAPLLAETVGRFSIENPPGGANSVLAGISFPRLERVGGRFSLHYLPALASAAFPLLESVGAELSIETNATPLETLAFPALRSVAGNITVERAPGLLSLSLPALARAAAFVYNKTSYGTYPLATLDLPALATVDGEIYLRDIPLASLDLPALESIGTVITLWDLQTLERLALPAIKHVGDKVYLYRPHLLASLDISSLDTLGTLELVDFDTLQTIKTPPVIGNVTLNYAAKNSPVPSFNGLEKIKGTLSFTSDGNVTGYEVNGIREIGTLRLTGGKKPATLDLPAVEKIGTLEIGSYNLAKLDAPKLESVEALKFSYVYTLADINVPLLRAIGSFTFSEHGSWDTRNARATHLNAFAGVTSIGSVTITYCDKLVDFSGLAAGFSTVPPGKWSVTGCAYNPTYQEMTDGKHVKPPVE